LLENDCATQRAFQKNNELKMSGEQVERLSAAVSKQCDLEKSSNEALRACIARNEETGNFCGFASCFAAFKTALPRETHFTPHLADSLKYEKICREMAAMDRCFANDACAGERCSLQLRIAIGAGRLIDFVAKREQSQA